jgi:hypothetical protein
MNLLNYARLASGVFLSLFPAGADAGQPRPGRGGRPYRFSVLGIFFDNLRSQFADCLAGPKCAFALAPAKASFGRIPVAGGEFGVELSAAAEGFRAPAAYGGGEPVSPAASNILKAGLVMSKDKSTKDNKLVILYHRSYRKLPGSTKMFLLHFAFLALPFSALSVIFYPEITEWICIATKNALDPYYYDGSVNILSRRYIEAIGPLFYVQVPDSFPSYFFSLANAVVTLLLLMILPFIQRFKPFLIFTVILCMAHAVSSLYFLLFPADFPYTAGDYSQLYMLQEISIWFFMPIIMGMAVLPMPASFLLKAGTMVSLYLYSLLFGLVRYIVFLMILSKISMIYMAVLFFALGPLVDFIYAVGIYTLFVNKVAKNLAEDFSLWRWQ